MLVRADGHGQGHPAARRGVRSPAAAAASAATEQRGEKGHENLRRGIRHGRGDGAARRARLRSWSVVRARHCWLAPNPPRVVGPPTHDDLVTDERPDVRTGWWRGRRVPLVPGHASFVVNPLTTRVPTGADRAATSRKRHPNSGCSIKRPACRVPHAMEPRPRTTCAPPAAPSPLVRPASASDRLARAVWYRTGARGDTNAGHDAAGCAAPPDHPRRKCSRGHSAHSHIRPRLLPRPALRHRPARVRASAGRRLRRQVERRDHPAEGGSRRGPTPAPPGHRARRGHRARAARAAG